MSNLLPLDIYGYLEKKINRETEGGGGGVRRGGGKKTRRVRIHFWRHDNQHNDTHYNDVQHYELMNRNQLK